ncbi:hypothetical protein AB0392_02865 [Nonomuraea angiospora]|uniref:hypothetical protein n=1 Tax=Nonomuraea angiospora TaxID=46172 RepID=UPI00344D8D94
MSSARRRPQASSTAMMAASRSPALVRAPAGERSASQAAMRAPMTVSGTCWPAGSRWPVKGARATARWWSSVLSRPSFQASLSTPRSAATCLLR